MKRFGVSLEEDLLQELDAFVSEQRFPNRSQAIRFLIRNNLVKDKGERNQNVSGCIVLVYDHHRRDLLSKLVAIQHKHEGLILSSQHVHLDHDNCIESILLKGKADQIKTLADNLIAIKGIKHGQLVISLVC